MLRIASILVLVLAGCNSGPQHDFKVGDKVCGKSSGRVGVIERVGETCVMFKSEDSDTEHYAHHSSLEKVDD